MDPTLPPDSKVASRSFHNARLCAPLDDEALLRALLLDEPAPVRGFLGELRRRAGGPLRRILSRLPSSRVSYELDDLFHEGVSALWARDRRLLRRWDPTRGLCLRGFALMVIVRNARTLLVRAARRASVARSMEDECGDLPLADEEGRLVARRQLDQLRDSLRLPARECDRQLFEWHFVEERSVGEIAIFLGQRANAVSQRLHRLRRRAAAILTDESAVAARVPPRTRRVRRSPPAPSALSACEPRT